MNQNRGLEHLPGCCETQLLGLAADSRENFAVSERQNCKIGKSDERKRPKCSSRNAIMARMNRLKKKKFLESLERDVARLSDENAKLKNTLKGQSSLVCSLRKEINYLKGVMANNKEISMLIKSIHNTGLPVTSSLSKHSPINQINSTVDHNYVCTRNDSSTATNFSGLFGKDSATLASNDEEEQVAIIDDVALSLSMPHDSTLDLPLLSPPERNLYDTEFSGYSVHSSACNSPVTGSAVDDELFVDAGVCLHVANSRVSLEFCSTCSSNALLAWEDVDTEK